MTATDIPTSLDELVRDSRDIIARLRVQWGDPADFQYIVRGMLEGFLIEGGADRKTTAYVMRCLFDDR